MAGVLDVRRAPDGIYLACDGERILATAYEAESGWWQTYLPSGLGRRMYEPRGDGEAEEARAASSVLKRRLAA